MKNSTIKIVEKNKPIHRVMFELGNLPKILKAIKETTNAQNHTKK